MVPTSIHPTPPPSPTLPGDLPHDLGAEKRFLGSLLRGGREAFVEVFTAGFEEFHDAWFFLPFHARVCRALREILRHEDDADPEAVCDYLRDHGGSLGRDSEMAFVRELIESVPTAADAVYHAAVLDALARQREIIRLCGSLMQQAWQEQDGDGIERVLLEAVQGFGRLAQNSQTGPVDGLVTMKDHVITNIETVEVLYSERGSLLGLPTGIVSLDKLLNGLEPGRVTLIAGRPSTGKSTLVRQIVDHVAVERNTSVGVFSLKTNPRQYVRAMLCSRSHVSVQKIADGFLSERDFPNLTNAASKLGDAPIFIDDLAGPTVGQLRAHARRLKMKHGIRLLVIDRLSLVRADAPPKDGNRTQITTEVIVGLKMMARELDVPVVVIASLNRGAETRSGGVPRLSDLRDSGSLEETADTVLFLCRMDQCTHDENEKENKAGEVELLVAKHYNGSLHKVELNFNGSYQYFTDVNAPPEAVAKGKPAQPAKTTGRKKS